MFLSPIRLSNTATIGGSNSQLGPYRFQLLLLGSSKASRKLVELALGSLLRPMQGLTEVLVSASQVLVSVLVHRHGLTRLAIAGSVTM